MESEGNPSEDPGRVLDRYIHVIYNCRVFGPDLMVQPVDGFISGCLV